MPKCPRCGKEIDKIYNVQSGYMVYTLDKDGNYVTDSGFESDGTMDDFCCPQCNLSLFPDSEENAIAFLNGKIEVKYDEEQMRVVVIETH
jgi:hypothetical protein